jgi:CheY-like chemotaxis protein
MNTPLLALPVSSPIPDAVKKKRVLLIDASHAKRDLRAQVLRKCGIEVDSAADIAEARAWWRPALYDLVLINMENGGGQRDRFCDDLRSATPPQRLAFLVGQPEYLADLPNADQEFVMESGDERSATGSIKVSSPDPGELHRRWGILEASRRISAVRSASVARRKAMHALPPPLRDSEGRPEKKLAATPTSLDDLLKEELR